MARMASVTRESVGYAAKGNSPKRQEPEKSAQESNETRLVTPVYRVPDKPVTQAFLASEDME